MVEHQSNKLTVKGSIPFVTNLLHAIKQQHSSMTCEGTSVRQKDTLAEWLRRQPAKLVRIACVGSNPTGVVESSLV